MKRYRGYEGSRLSYAVAQLAAMGGLYRGSDNISPKQLLPLDERTLSTTATVGFANKTLVVTPDVRRAESLYHDLEFLTELPCGLFLPWEVLPFESLSPPIESIADRIKALSYAISPNAAIIITTPEALLQKLCPLELFRSSQLSLQRGELINRDQLLRALTLLGYYRVGLVEEIGQMAVRGAVVDLFPPDMKCPLRLELFGDELESLRWFDPSSQRSIETINNWTVLPVTEFLPPWHSARGALAGEQEVDVEPYVEVIKRRANELEVQQRDIDSIVDVIRTHSGWPGIEQLLPLFVEKMSSFFDYLGAHRLIVCGEAEVVEGASSYQSLIREREHKARADLFLHAPAESGFMSEAELGERLRAADFYFDDSSLITLTDADLAAELGQGEIAPNQEELPLLPQRALDEARRIGRYQELPLRPLMQQIEKLQGEGFSVAVAVSHPSRKRRFLELFESYSISCVEFAGPFTAWKQARPSQMALLQGSLSSGFVSPWEGISIIADHEILPGAVQRRSARSAESVKRLIGSVSQMRENDYVVHVDRGIAIYRGLRQITVEGKTADFIYLEFAEGAKLFVPIDQIQKVQKYVGAEGRSPQLSKLGGAQWSKTKQKVKEQVAQLAGQLLNLYAEREMSRGFAFESTAEDDEAFASTFGFQETPDQGKAIRETLADMAQPKPMDRLVCGDVGYGKTEVALRAAFRAMNSGKQVAFLVPTTVLADQHFGTCLERFKEFPFKVGCVSRFYSSADNKKTLMKIASGELDMVVGTHRLLQRDVIFNNLGLVIIDEEHRFGVADKERLKRMRKEVDVLTLTATPIPRTLHMSLLGIRDLSVIETAPTDRQVIRTYLAPYQDGVVREAVLRELGRKGQVFYIHNRVENIAQVAAELRALVPEARIEFAHGQMKDDELERAMHRFILHEIDILVSTTIVESGLDIPNANTIIIRDADRLGLAELYQLRGRVGRSSRRAYAYLFISESRNLGADAKKRLQALQALDDLGMGFKLALQDMEIRGAGNLLGKDQTGKIDLVGFELYTKILKEAVKELRGRQSELDLDFLALDPEVNLPVTAYIPADYVPDVEERLLLYQRLVDFRSKEEGQAMFEELEDRFGPVPKEVRTLIEVMIFRATVRRAYVLQASLRGETLSIAFHPKAKINGSELLKYLQAEKGRAKFSPSNVLSVKLAQNKFADVTMLTETTEEILRRVVLP